MTATDELRRMLDERGVKWGNIRRDGSESNFLTEWQFDGNEGNVVATERAIGGELSVEIHRYHLTAAQAIDATLGRGTCKMVVDNNHRVDNVTTSWGCVCSSCGGFHKFTHGDGWAYCPSCGRAVER